MATSTQWQVARDVAERYEIILVPSIVGPFARALVDAVAPRRDDRIVDVGCGTGAAARYAAKCVGPGGRVDGVDINAGMLEVARSLPDDGGAPVEWHEASALALPLADGAADVVLLAQVLQFVPDRKAALAEARRVLRPSGRVAIGLWCPLERNPYFHALVDAIALHLGDDVANGSRSAFDLSDAVAIRALMADAGFRDVASSPAQLDLVLPLPQEFVPLHLGATPTAAAFSATDDATRAAIVRDVDRRMEGFRVDGALRVPFRSHLAIGVR